MQRFVLQQNAERYRARLAEAKDPGERDRLTVMLSTVERELALYAAEAEGVGARPWPIGAQAQLAADRARLTGEFRAKFEDWPQVAYLIDPAPGLSFVAVNTAFEQATSLSRHQIEGQPLFTLFPDNPNDATADGTWQIYASMRRVAETGQPDHMAPMRYDVRDADGAFVKRYWRHANTALFNAAGRLIFLQHLVDEVTEQVIQARSSAA
ncbi:PAS domain-containing protein [Phenylobacterium sp.]|uniref:PAS domain-containing protein n=1 Tax=Phenylobacterium sp. TaxID=1871053 RepID=UPI002BACFA3D|nr:PAS domain-containing protein [Phenylobacterium sp.]HLZ75017.1 PAS domain-containing protein [Phenylobacterium sp.]